MKHRLLVEIKLGGDVVDLVDWTGDELIQTQVFRLLLSRRY